MRSDESLFDPGLQFRADLPDGAEPFRRHIYDYYRARGREFPWRETHDPYRIVVSELMLQQTQTDRVAAKYAPFLERFPDFQTLASASLAEVYQLWKGLGYNRRAKALRDISQRVVEEHDGVLPDSPELLQTFPGIGPYTAGAICAFAFNLPVVFIETNIRRVFLHLFFPTEEQVHDRTILPLVEATLDRSDPRAWYYALMDYGAALGRRGTNPNQRSIHYARQSTFENSNRQIRGRILALLAAGESLSDEEIAERISFPQPRVFRSLVELSEEGMVVREVGSYRLSE